jgi:hypothetical protein
MLSSRKKLSPEETFRKIILERAELMRPAPDKPIRLKLFHAYLTLLKRWLTHVKVRPDETLVMPFDALTFLPGMRELLGWITPPWKSLSESEQERYRKGSVTILINAGKTIAEMVGYIPEWNKEKRRGRTPSLRFAAIDAYEDKLRRPELTWAMLTVKHCRCDKSAHDFYDRRDALKREAGLLRVVLKKYRHPQKWQPLVEDFDTALRFTGLGQVRIISTRRRLSLKTP